MKNEAVIVHRLNIHGQIFISLNDFVRVLERHIEHNQDQPYTPFLKEIMADFVLLKNMKQKEVTDQFGDDEGEIEHVMYPLQSAIAGVIDMYNEKAGDEKTAYASVYNLLKQLQGLDNINLN